MKLEGFDVVGFDVKNRKTKDERDHWYLMTLKNKVGDRITIRTGNKEAKKLVVGEDITVEFDQAQTKLADDGEEEQVPEV